MKNLFLIVVLIFVGQAVGSLIGLIKKPEEKILRFSFAFSSSMMLGISFFQLLPESLKVSPLISTITWFLLGIIFMKFVDSILPHINPGLFDKKENSLKKTVLMLVIGIAVHNFPEGLAIGAGFALGANLGIMIAFGIAAQDVPENIATIVPLYGLIGKRLKSFIVLTGTVLFEIFGFILGYYFLRGGSIYLLGNSLALAAGFMTYISIDELIPASKIKENPKLVFSSILSGLLISFLLSIGG